MGATLVMRSGRLRSVQGAWCSAARAAACTASSRGERMRGISQRGARPEADTWQLWVPPACGGGSGAGISERGKMTPGDKGGVVLPVWPPAASRPPWPTINL